MCFYHMHCNILCYLFQLHIHDTLFVIMLMVEVILFSKYLSKISGSIMSNSFFQQQVMYVQKYKLLIDFYQLVCIPHFVLFYLLFICPLFYLPVFGILYIFLFFKDFIPVPLKSKSNFLASIEGYVHTHILKLRCELMTRKTN